MSVQKEHTFQELAQMALGGGQMKTVNVGLLYAVIDLLLKKLNCENEKVTVIGVPAKNLQKLLLKSSTGTPLTFNAPTVDSVKKQFDTLAKLEEQIEAVEINLEDHLAKTAVASNGHGDSNDEPCRTNCTVEEPQSEIIHALTKNEWFIKRLQDVLSVPMTCRFNRTVIKLRELTAKLDKFKIDSNIAHARINKMEEILVSLLNLRKAFEEYNANFLSTMEEIQEVMDSKVDNRETLPIKRYFQNRFEQLLEKVNFFVYERTKPRALFGGMEPSTADELEMKLKKFLSGVNIKCAPKLENCECSEANMAVQMSLAERVEVLDTKELLRRSHSERVSLSMPDQNDWYQQ